MNMNIFRNYGCLSKEKSAVYTYGNPQPTAKYHEEIAVKLPDGWETYESISGETILTAPWGENYTMHEVLCGNEYPCLRTLENGNMIRLEVI